MSGPRAELLKRIAELCRGDWSGHVFDGRGVCRWILTALDGDEAALTELAQELTDIEGGY